MDIYDKIDAIFSGEAEEKPQWASEILDELKEIKALLATQTTQVMKKDNAYYAFIKNFRIYMQANTAKDVYPTFYYQDRRLGVDLKGFLYDKETSKIISKSEAFKIYKYAYEEHKHSKHTA